MLERVLRLWRISSRDALPDSESGLPLPLLGHRRRRHRSEASGKRPPRWAVTLRMMPGRRGSRR